MVDGAGRLTTGARLKENFLFMLPVSGELWCWACCILQALQREAWYLWYSRSSSSTESRERTLSGRVAVGSCVNTWPYHVCSGPWEAVPWEGIAVVRSYCQWACGIDGAREEEIVDQPPPALPGVDEYQNSS